MRFRLTYEGPLFASGRDPEGSQRVPIAEHKQSIRKAFHGQLKRHWETNKFLKEHSRRKGAFVMTPGIIPG